MGEVPVNGFGAAAGDGTTDDHPAFAAALAAMRGPGGVLKIPDGRVYRLGSGLTWNLTTDGPLVVVAEGATIDYTGTGVCFDLSASTSAGTTPKAKIQGGHWKGREVGAAAFRVTDATGCTFDPARIDGYTAGTGVVLRNLSFWTEQTTIGDVAFPSCQHAVDFQPASVSGGAGTESFARTTVGDIRVGHGIAHQPQVRCRGGVYDSRFGRVNGNIGDDVIVFHLSGSMGGTLIASPAIENNLGQNGTGTLFDWGTITGSAPTIEGPITLRSNIALSTGTARAEMGRIPSTLSRLRTTDGPAASTDPTPDDVLTVPVAANSKYAVDAPLAYSADPSADFKLKFDAPTGSTFYWTLNAPSPASAAGSGNAGVDKRQYGLAHSPAAGGLGTGTPAVATVVGTLLTGPTSGAFTVMGAQNTAHASDARFAAGAALHLTPIITT